MRPHVDLDPWKPRPMAVIERLDFLGVPTQDPERSRTFYRDVLGLRPDEHAEWEQWAGDTCFGIWEPEKQGMPFVARRAIRGPCAATTSRGWARGSRARAASSSATPPTPASATWRSSPTPTATS